MFNKKSILRIAIALLSLGLVVPVPALSALEAHADTVVQVAASGTAQVVAVDGPDGSSNIASVDVGGVIVPISDPAQADSLFSGDQVSFTVDVPATVVAGLSSADQATLAGQPVVNGVIQIGGDTALGVSLLQQTLVVTQTPLISGLVVDASPATEPLLPTADDLAAGAPIGGTPITPSGLNQTIHLAIAFAGSDINPWITDAAAMDYIAQVQTWYRQYTGWNFVFTVSAVAHLTNASATICGDTSAAVTEINRAAGLFGQASYSSYVNSNRVHLVVLEDMTSPACANATFAGLGTVTGSSASIPGYNAGGALMVRFSQNPNINGGPLYGVRSVAHELGHNFGFNHSNTLMCSAADGVGSWNQSLAGACLNLEYGDMFDIMGHHQTPGAMGATRKYQSGLLASSAVVTINTLVTNQTVTLTMMPTGDNASAQLIYIDNLVPTVGSKDPYIVAGAPYLVELRRQTNMDGSTTGLPAPGFVVLRANRTQTWMLQPTVPGLNSGNLVSTVNKQMGAGDTFTSADGMIILTVVSVPAATCTANCTGVIQVTRSYHPVLRFTLSPDMTGDGRGEVLAVDGSGILWMYPGTATGQLGSRIKLGTGFADMQISAPGDVNSDGKADVFAVDGAGALWLYPGNGIAMLGTRKQVGNGWTGWQLATPGDLTGDGKPDLLGVDSAGDLYMYAGKGDGTFYAKVLVGNGWTGSQLYGASDLNGDGKADILSIDAAGDLYQYLGKGNGTFYAKVLVGNGWNGFTMAAGADLNGGGLADIVGLEQASGILYVYLGRGNGTFAMKQQIATGWW